MLYSFSNYGVWFVAGKPFMVSRSGPVFAAKQCDNARRMNQNQRYEVLMHFPGYEGSLWHSPGRVCAKLHDDELPLKLKVDKAPVRNVFLLKNR